MSGVTDGPPESAAAMIVALRSGQTAAVELVERSLSRAEAWQPDTNAFSQMWAEEALAGARGLDAALAAGEELPPLAGIPVAVKDLYDVAGHETTGCSEAYAGNVAEHDAVTIERVRAAGLVMIGKTNQHELAAGGTNTVSACGRTGNPWDRARITGGSSGGSGAAVASGSVPWALGSDTGGSIRIPASLCGTFGLKPTFGTLPTEGLMPLSPAMDCPGPMAATAVDLWLLYCVLLGGEIRVPPPEWADPRAPEPFRVAVLDGFFEEVLHHETKRTVQAVADVLAEAGVHVESAPGRGLEGSRAVWSRICFPEFAESHPALKDPARRAMVAPSVAEWLELGERFSAEERADAERRREEIGRWYGEHLEGFDALLIPTTPYPAPRAEEREVDLGPNGTVSVDEVGTGYITCTVSLTGLPAVNIPAGRSSEGLPIGVTLVGGGGEEETLCRLAAVLDAAAS